MVSDSKSAQLQIRVSPEQKSAIARAAKRAGVDMSAYVLARVLPELHRSFEAHASACREDEDAAYGLAALNTFLSTLTPAELGIAVATAPSVPLSAFTANYVAAMVECACAGAKISTPRWTRSIAPLAIPHFGSTLQSLRLHLLTHSPAPFRNRNLFIDSTLGAQI